MVYRPLTWEEKGSKYEVFNWEMIVIHSINNVVVGQHVMVSSNEIEIVEWNEKCYDPG